jgi:hypothetical protein
MDFEKDLQKLEMDIYFMETGFQNSWKCISIDFQFYKSHFLS